MRAVFEVGTPQLTAPKAMLLFPTGETPSPSAMALSANATAVNATDARSIPTTTANLRREDAPRPDPPLAERASSRWLRPVTDLEDSFTTVIPPFFARRFDRRSRSKCGSSTRDAQDVAAAAPKTCSLG